MATLQDVRSQNWQLSTSQTGEIVQGLADIMQCVDVILSTQKGSDPFRPNFGVDVFSFIDEPINAAVPILVREITEQIELWEQRIRLTELRHEVRESNLIISMKWDSPLGAGENTASFAI